MIPSSRLFWVSFVAVTISLFSVGQAQTGLTGGKSGYRVSVHDCLPTSGAAYRAIQIQIETIPSANVKNDEEFSVSILSHSRYRGIQRVIQAPVTIKAGASSGKVEMNLTDQGIRSLRMHSLLVEKGQGNGRFDRRDLLMAEFAGRRGRPLAPTQLFVSSSAHSSGARHWLCFDGKSTPSASVAQFNNNPIPSFAIQQDVYLQPDQRTNPQSWTVASWNVIGNCEWMGACPPKQLPQNWVGLSGLDQLLISKSDLDLLADKFSAQRNAMERWLAAGGCLVVFDVGSKIERVDRITDKLNNSNRLTEPTSNAMEWRIPPSKIEEMEKLIRLSNRRSYYYRDELWIQKGDALIPPFSSWESFDPDLDTLNEPDLVIGNYQNGKIVALTDDLQNWTLADWRRLHNSVVSAGKSITGRIGLTNGASYADAFAIPGVGEPPVGAFQLLISLFIVVAGPVLFFVLKRTGHMQYFYFVVPLLSFTVCVGLMGYAIFVDGFESWGRNRSLTYLDQRLQSAVTHDRSAYYSGVGPTPYQYGLDNAIMIPALENSPTLRVSQGEKSLELSGGNIRARMPHQVTRVRSQLTEKRILVGRTRISADEKSKVLPVTNQMEAPLKLAVFRTEQGWFIANNVAKNQQVLAEPLDAKRVDDLFKQATVSEVYRETSRGYRYHWSDDDFGNSWGDELWVFQKLSDLQALSLFQESNCYVAIFDEPPVTDNRPANVIYRQQLHVVIGKW